MPRADGPFEVLEKVNDHANKIDLPGEYGVSCTFNVADIKPYFEDDKLENLRANSFLELEDDVPMKDQHDELNENSKSQEIKSTSLFDSRATTWATFWFEPRNGPTLLAHILNSETRGKMFLALT